MHVRAADFDDVFPVAELLQRRSRGKTTDHLCRSRVQQAIKRSIIPRKQFIRALVAVDGGKVLGFLYAEERQLFDLCPDIRVVEVPFLVGSHGSAVALLTRLREQTLKRILVQSVVWLGKPAAFARLTRKLNPRQFAVVWQI